MKHQAPSRSRSPMAEHRRHAAKSTDGPAWLLLLQPEVLLLVVAGVWIVARGDHLLGALILAACGALAAYVGHASRTKRKP